MEVFLYNSTVCRLCSEENDNGTLLYSSEENNQSLCDIINTYLPLKVSDDGQLPRTICPGCTIQLEATVEFLNLIINGQKVIRELYEREKQYKKSLGTEIISENIIYEIKTSHGVYQVEHPIALQVAGLDKPKRKRGRPPKKHKSPEEMLEERVQVQEPKPVTVANETKEDEEYYGKRRRKTPTRFKEAVQGKELERIFLESGVIDEVESDQKVKPVIQETPEPKESKVIGHLEDSGELVVVQKGKGRGRPKGRMQPTHEVCSVCDMKFSSVGRYMSHMAMHAREARPLAPQTSEPPQQNITPDNVEVVNANTQEKDSNIPTQESPDLNPEPIVCKSESEVPSSAVLEDAQQTDIEIETVDNDDPLAIYDDNNEKMVDDEDYDTTDEESQMEDGKVKLKCKFCDKVYSTKQSRSVHIKAVHMGERSHMCMECGAKFAYPRSLALHRLSHRRERPGGYACDICGKVLNHPSSVVYHKQTEHDTQRFVCGTCGKRFRHKQLLQRHQLVHSELRPFVCKTCNSSFKTKPNLINHQLLHTGIKKFNCEICKAKFAHKTSLTLHMRWHTGVKPFSCAVCTKGFSQKGNLVEHMRIHTGEKPFACKQCPRRFTTSSQHRLHLRRHAQQRAALRESGMAAREAAVQAAQRKRTVVKNKLCVKQMSLLVDKKPQKQRVKPLTMVERARRDSSSDRVIYVAYEAAHNIPAFQIMNPEQSAVLEENSSLLVPHALGLQHDQLGLDNVQLQLGSEKLETEQLDLESEPLELESEPLELESEPLELESEPLELESEPLELESEPLELESEPLELESEPLELESEQLDLDDELDCKLVEETHVSVTDAAGNPLHFTMQDGTRLAITSVDGRSLQVITQDGQTIPVEINGYTEPEAPGDGGSQYFGGGLSPWKK